MHFFSNPEMCYVIYLSIKSIYDLKTEISRGRKNKRFQI